MSLPVIEISGDSFTQGLQHGQQLASRVHHNIEVYYDRLNREVGLDRTESQRRAGLYLDAITVQNPEYVQGMRGVAEGANKSLLDIAVLNVRYELLYYQFGVGAVVPDKVPEVDGCTAFAVLPSQTDNGHLWLGQNWDWIPEVHGAVLKSTEPDGSRTLSFTEAGIVGGKIGLSSRGIGVCINGMTTMDDDWSTLRKPVHVRCWEILRAQSFEDAVSVITDEPRSCTTNFLIAGTPDGVADLEAGPEKLRRIDSSDGILIHTNNFLDPAMVGVVEAPSERRPYSIGRCDRMTELLSHQQKPISVSALQSMLKDHTRMPFGICRHRDPEDTPENHYITVTSIIMDLDAKGMLLTDGPPCESEYQKVTL